MIGKIQKNLFAKCPEVENVWGAFYNCTKITEIPETLFENNTKLLNLLGHLEIVLI